MTIMAIFVRSQGAKSGERSQKSRKECISSHIAKYSSILVKTRGGFLAGRGFSSVFPSPPKAPKVSVKTRGPGSHHLGRTGKKEGQINAKPRGAHRLVKFIGRSEEA